ncbi:MAG: diaminopimelate epimerase [Aquificaceae bacterium]|nr:diaminopimelate epimerase [Aquificaceae bacterium]
MKFSKLQGSGNDFILIDNRDDKVELLLQKLRMSIQELVVNLCRPHTGVGADGLILIEHPQDPKNHFRWRFFNADGSVAEMCGNGSRCAVRFAYEMGIAGEQVSFETLAGVIRAQVLEGGSRVKVQLTKPKDYREVSLEVEGELIQASFLNTGVPHLVVIVQDVQAVDVAGLGRALRFHRAFQPWGTNVNFVQAVSSRSVKVRTYERGVEAETLACGTGATASALVAYGKGLVREKPVEVLTAGGELLRIYFDEKMEEVFLEGGVCKVFEGILTEEALLCMRELNHGQG